MTLEFMRPPLHYTGRQAKRKIQNSLDQHMAQ